MKKWMKALTIGVFLGMTLIVSPIHGLGAELTAQEESKIEKLRTEYQKIEEQRTKLNHQTFNDLFTTQTNFTTPYNVGALKDDYQTFTINYFNFIRSFNDLPAIQTSTEDALLAQQAVAGMASVDNMTHHLIGDGIPRPSYMSESDWTLADKGTSSSNLLYTTASEIGVLEMPLNSWLEDDGSNNLRVGHRAWMLSYTLKSSGIGLAKSPTNKIYGALRVIGNHSSTPAPQNQVASWPSAGVFPIESIPSEDFRWSTHFDAASYDISNATVKLENETTQQQWTFATDAYTGEFNIDNSGGIGRYVTLTFNPINNKCKAGDSYKVTVSGLKSATGTAMADYSYTVKFFTLKNVTSVTLDKTAAEVKIGNTLKLTPTIQPIYASNQTVSWTSSNPEVASIDATGIVTAKKEGTATITVTSEEGAKTAVCEVTVPKPVGVPLYRAYNPNSGEHLYTISQGEYVNLTSIGWKAEGEAWESAAEGGAIFRLYNPNSGEHFYTTSQDEYNSVAAKGWRKEGIVFYSSEAQEVAVYRLFNPNAKGAGSHHYTTKVGERDSLVASGWTAEGIAFYGVK